MERETGLVARLPALVAALACLGGLGMIATGLAVPMEASAGQQRLEREFERELAAGRDGKIEDHAAPQVAFAARPVPGPVTAKPTRRAQPRVAQPLPASGVVARLMVKRLGVREVVVAGDGTHEQLAAGPAMIRREDTQSPVMVLAAHRDTHFLFVRDLGAGDEIVLQLVTGETRRYRVVRFETTEWNRFAIPLGAARPLLALSTCYPFGGTEYGGPLRRIAWAEQVG